VHPFAGDLPGDLRSGLIEPRGSGAVAGSQAIAMHDLQRRRPHAHGLRKRRPVERSAEYDPMKSTRNRPVGTGASDEPTSRAPRESADVGRLRALATVC
jgi:hypothetical protein